MDALVRDGLGGEPVYANGAMRSESPAKLLFLALTWLLTATAAGFATAVLVGIAVIL